MTWLVLASVVVLTVVGAPRWRAHRAAERERREVGDALPEVADLLIVVLGAGVEIASAVRWLADRGPPSTSAAFEHVAHRADQGLPLSVALRSLSTELGSGYRPLTTILIAAVRDGVSTADLLLRIGDEARSARRRRQDRQARTLPVHLLFPLVTCSLPAVMIGAVLPLVLVAIGRV